MKVKLLVKQEKQKDNFERGREKRKEDEETRREKDWKETENEERGANVRAKSDKRAKL